MGTAFFVVSKLVGALIRLDTWVVISLGAILLALLFERLRLAKILSAVTFAILAVLAILPLGNLLLQPIERSFPTNPALTHVDGIIVLGGGEDARATAYWHQIQLNEGGDRYTAALELAHRFPGARLLFTGGSGALRDLAGTTVTEAAAAGKFFREQGISSDRLLLESQSRNTAENARHSFVLAHPVPGQVWVLVTSAFHMSRAMRAFTTAGWTGVVPYPVDYRTSAFRDGIGWDLTRHIDVMDTAIKEDIGLLAYRITGR